MKNLVRPLALVLGLTVNTAFGALFNFSYTFGDGLVVSGSLTGTQNGAFVDNVTNVTLLFNGTPAPGTIFSSKYDSSSPNSFVNGAVVSFNALQNNFLFSNSDVINGNFGFDSFFDILNTSVYAFNTAVGQSIPLNVFGSQDLPTVAQNWSLTAAPTTAPDGGTTLVLLGIGLAGMVWLRRKL
jgi:hypothetical protein